MGGLEKVLGFLFLVLLAAKSEALQCAQGWVQNRFGCFVATTTRNSTFDNAGFDCYGLLPSASPNLASIHSFSANQAIYTSTGIVNSVAKYYIGLFERGGTWYWSDGTSVDFLNWAPGQPSPSTSPSLRCAVMNGQGLWETLDCNTLLPHICECQPNIPGSSSLAPPVTIVPTSTITTTAPVTTSVGSTTTGLGPCRSNPCQNSGTCTATGPYSYVCHCKLPYTGSNCQTGPCSMSPCLNGGTCSVQGTSFSCKCPPFFTGSICQLTTPCSFNPCQNGGICHINGSSFTCTCPAGSTGPRCQNKVDACLSNPCLNSGTCISRPGGNFTCTCPPDYTGAVCQTTLPCMGRPCLHGGQCINDGASGYQCICPSQYFGRDCDIAKCPVTVKSSGWYILDIKYDVGTSNPTTRVYRNGAVTFNAATGTDVNLNAVLGSDQVCNLDARDCSKPGGYVINCGGTTFSMSCSCGS